MSDIQVNQKIRVAPPMVAGTRLFEKSRRRPEFSFLVTNALLFSPKKIKKKKKLDVLFKGFPVDLILIYIPLEVSKRAVLLMHKFILIGNSVP